MAKINPGLLMALSAVNNVDTKNYDNVLKNFETKANEMSGNSNLGNWIWGVDGSDDARQRAEAATFQAYLDKTQPIYQQQKDDLHNRLINQGLSVGSEAYERAMNDLQNNQNDATNQAAYNSVLNGQNAFTQSLNDSLNSASFANSAQTGYIGNIWNLLANSMSGYDKKMEQANLVSSIFNQAQSQKSQKGGLSGALSGATTGAITGAKIGGPWGALAGGVVGGIGGYYS
ncbi:MAG: hypothetical protein IJ660_00835 [Alphaproteobacteria bacterium]|nr:hypothetical protein [Alphaproteobacteria bacterium]